jgi:hypothetical protein
MSVVNTTLGMEKMIFKQAQRFVLVVILLLAVSVAQAAPVTAKLDRSSAVVGETITLILQARQLKRFYVTTSLTSNRCWFRNNRLLN